MVHKPSDPTGEIPAPTVRIFIGAIRDADTIYIAFPRLQRALVVDFRHGEAIPPAVLVTDLRFTVDHQMEAVAQLRPGLPPVARFVSAPWGGSTRAFAEQGVLPAILNRLPDGHTHEAMAAFNELREMERAAGPSAQHAPPQDTDREVPDPGG